MKSYIPLNILTFALVLGVCMHNESVAQSEDEFEDKSEPEDGVFRFKPPKLNDEEEHSQHMPSTLKCDGCKAIAFQLSQGFRKAEGPSSRKLKESDILDVTENVCTHSFEQYGLKTVKEVKHLSGPGLPASDAPGIIQGGGKWPRRLAGMCSHYLEEMGEEELYDAYLDDKQLVNTLCYRNGEFGRCSQNKDEL